MATFVAETPYVNVTFTYFSDGRVTGAMQTFDLDGETSSSEPISAVHIHSAVNTSSVNEPILVWLLTSEEWNAGVLQNTPLVNYPCCAPNESSSGMNNMCTAIAPPNTPLTRYSSNSTLTFDHMLSYCPHSTCPSVCKGTLLNIHGYSFQQVYYGCPTGGQPGLDMILSVPFTRIMTVHRPLTTTKWGIVKKRQKK